MIERARIPSRVAKILAAVVVISALAGCGQTDVRPAAPVRLTQLSPADGMRVSRSTVTVSGIVKPRTARVLVEGRSVVIGADGSFSIRVALATGTNLIDVIAGAAHARPAMTAVRVVRYVLVTVPAVGGANPAAAAAAIRAAGLKPKVGDDNDPFAILVPGSYEVCGQSPPAHSRVSPGTVVHISVGKVCL